jgi:hypothetical protein
VRIIKMMKAAVIIPFPFSQMESGRAPLVWVAVVTLVVLLIGDGTVVIWKGSPVILPCRSIALATGVGMAEGLPLVDGRTTIVIGLVVRVSAKAIPIKILSILLSNHRIRRNSQVNGGEIHTFPPTSYSYPFAP